MINTTLLVAVITLIVESAGFLFMKGKDRFWILFLMVITIIVFATVYMLKRTIV